MVSFFKIYETKLLFSLSYIFLFDAKKIHLILGVFPINNLSWLNLDKGHHMAALINNCSGNLP